jgi:hypothetical protein
MSGDSLSNLVPAPQGSNRPNEFVFDGNIRCVILNGEPHWSIIDAYRIYGKASNPRSDWMRDLKELEEQGFDVVSNVRPYQFFNTEVNRHTRETPVANLPTFMRIAQVAKFKEWEPLRQKMAHLMAENVRNSFQKDAQWQMAYQGEMMSHDRFIDAIHEAVWFIMHGVQTQRAVDAVFRGLYKRTRQQIADRIGLKHINELESNQSFYALSYQGIAKQLAAEHLGERSELSFDEAKKIVRETAEIIAPQVHTLSKVLGRDIATNLPLLASGILDEVEQQVEAPDNDDDLRGLPNVPKPDDPWML